MPVQAIELREAVERTLSTSPDLGVFIEERKVTDHEFKRAAGRGLPVIDFRASAGEDFTNEATSSSVTLPRYDSGLTLRQLLFDGDESKSELELRAARQRSAARRVLQNSSRVALDAVDAYLESLRNRSLVELAAATVQAHKDTLANVEEIARGGAAGLADIKQVVSRLARAQDDHARARNRLDDADTTYRRVVGEAVESLQQPDPPSQALPGTVDEAVALAAEVNAAVKVAKSETVEAEAEYRKSKSNFWPRVSFEIAGNTSHNTGGSRGSDTNVSALLLLTYNLYRGGSDEALIQVNISRLAASRKKLDRVIRDVEQQVRLSWSALQTGRDRVTALQSAVLANEVVRATYREQFDLNQRSLLDLLDSENDLFIAKANLITSETVVKFGIYRILATTGRLLAALNVKAPPEARDIGLREFGGSSAPSPVKTKPAPPPVPAPIPKTPTPKTKVMGPASPVPRGRVLPGLNQSRHAGLAVAKPLKTPVARRRVVPLAPMGRASPVAGSIKRLPELAPNKRAQP